MPCHNQKRSNFTEKVKKGESEKSSRGRRSYSRLLSPFHLQLPLYFPELSPGRQTPLSTSASSTNSNSGIRPLAMPASGACIGATADSQWPWGVLSYAQSYLTQLHRDIQNNNTSSSSFASPGVLALGHNNEAPEGSHTHRRHTSSSLRTGMILLRAIALQTGCNSSIGRQVK